MIDNSNNSFVPDKNELMINKNNEQNNKENNEKQVIENQNAVRTNQNGDEPFTIILTLELDNVKTDIKFTSNQNPNEVAYNFCAENNLSFQSMTYLSDQIMAQLKYFEARKNFEKKEKEREKYFPIQEELEEENLLTEKTFDQKLSQRTDLNEKEDSKRDSKINTKRENKIIKDDNELLLEEDDEELLSDDEKNNSTKHKNAFTDGFLDNNTKILNNKEPKSNEKGCFIYSSIDSINGNNNPEIIQNEGIKKEQINEKNEIKENKDDLNIIANFKDDNQNDDEITRLIDQQKYEDEENKKREELLNRLKEKINCNNNTSTNKSMNANNSSKKLNSIEDNTNQNYKPKIESKNEKGSKINFLSQINQLNKRSLNSIHSIHSQHSKKSIQSKQSERSLNNNSNKNNTLNQQEEILNKESINQERNKTLNSGKSIENKNSIKNKNIPKANNNFKNNLIYEKKNSLNNRNNKLSLGGSNSISMKNLINLANKNIGLNFMNNNSESKTNNNLDDNKKNEPEKKERTLSNKKLKLEECEVYDSSSEEEKLQQEMEKKQKIKENKEDKEGKNINQNINNMANNNKEELSNENSFQIESNNNDEIEQKNTSIQIPNDDKNSNKGINNNKLSQNSESLSNLNDNLNENLNATTKSKTKSPDNRNIQMQKSTESDNWKSDLQPKTSSLVSPNYSSIIKDGKNNNPILALQTGLTSTNKQSTSIASHKSNNQSMPMNSSILNEKEKNYLEMQIPNISELMEIKKKKDQQLLEMDEEMKKDELEKERKKLDLLNQKEKENVIYIDSGDENKNVIKNDSIKKTNKIEENEEVKIKPSIKNKSLSLKINTNIDEVKDSNKHHKKEDLSKENHGDKNVIKTPSNTSEVNNENHKEISPKIPINKTTNRSQKKHHHKEKEEKQCFLCKHCQNALLQFEANLNKNHNSNQNSKQRLLLGDIDNNQNRLNTNYGPTVEDKRYQNFMNFTTNRDVNYKNSFSNQNNSSSQQQSISSSKNGTSPINDNNPNNLKTQNSNSEENPTYSITDNNEKQNYISENYYNNKQNNLNYNECPVGKFQNKVTQLSNYTQNKVNKSSKSFNKTNISNLNNTSSNLIFPGENRHKLFPYELLTENDECDITSNINTNQNTNPNMNNANYNNIPLNNNRISYNFGNSKQILYSSQSTSSVMKNCESTRRAYLVRPRINSMCRSNSVNIFEKLYNDAEFNRQIPKRACHFSSYRRNNLSQISDDGPLNATYGNTGINFQKIRIKPTTKVNINSYTKIIKSPNIKRNHSHNSNRTNFYFQGKYEDDSKKEKSKKLKIENAFNDFCKLRPTSVQYNKIITNSNRKNNNKQIDNDFEGLRDIENLSSNDEANKIDGENLSSGHRKNSGNTGSKKKIKFLTKENLENPILRKRLEEVKDDIKKKCTFKPKINKNYNFSHGLGFLQRQEIYENFSKPKNEEVLNSTKHKPSHSYSQNPDNLILNNNSKPKKVKNKIESRNKLGQISSTNPIINLTQISHNKGSKTNLITKLVKNKPNLNIFIKPNDASQNSIPINKDKRPNKVTSLYKSPITSGNVNSQRPIICKNSQMNTQISSNSKNISSMTNLIPTNRIDPNEITHSKKKETIFLKIFNLLDSDEDSIISYPTISLDRIPKHIIKIIEPILLQMKKEKSYLNQELFINFMYQLYVGLDINQKKLLYEFTFPHPKKEKNIVTNNDYVKKMPPKVYVGPKLKNDNIYPDKDDNNKMIMPSLTDVYLGNNKIVNEKKTKILSFMRNPNTEIITQNNNNFTYNRDTYYFSQKNLPKNNSNKNKIKHEDFN